MENKKTNTKVIISFLIVIVFIGAVVYFIMNKPEEVNPLDGITIPEDKIEIGDINTQQQETQQQEEQSSTSSNTMNQNIRQLENFTPVSKVDQLEKLDLVIGNGEEVKAGDTVSVHYTGAIASTGVIFQSSKDFGTDPITFPLSGVISGWTEGIPGMKVGGTRRLIIPADMAYVANPPAGSGIPANADLVFDVELISIQ